MQKGNVLHTALVGLVASVAVVVFYHNVYVAKNYVDQRDASKLGQAMEPVLWNIIRQNPDAFFKVMNEAAQVQQEKVRSDLEKSASLLKDRIFSAGVRMGSQDANAVQFVAFVDMMDPVSHEFQKVALRTMRDKNDISFRMIPLAINGLNSEVMARFILAANLQKNGNMMQFLEAFLDKISQMSRAKLLDTAKAAGFDISQIEKSEGDKKVEEDLASGMRMGEEIKIQGTPTVFVVHRDGKITLVPPMDVGGFLELAQSIRAEKSEKSPEGQAAVVKTEEKQAEVKVAEAVVHEVKEKESEAKGLEPKTDKKG